MVAIKSIIILTLSAFAMASPIFGGKDFSDEKSGEESHGDGRPDQSVEAQGIHCQKDTRLACCNSKNKGSGILGGFALNNQCTDVNVPVNVLAVTGLFLPCSLSCIRLNSNRQFRALRKPQGREMRGWSAPVLRQQ